MKNGEEKYGMEKSSQEKLGNLWSSKDIIRMVRMRRMRWPKQVRMRK